MLPKASGICAHCQRYTQMLPPRLNFRYGQIYVKIDVINYDLLGCFQGMRLFQTLADNLL